MGRIFLCQPLDLGIGRINLIIIIQRLARPTGMQTALDLTLAQHIRHIFQTISLILYRLDLIALFFQLFHVFPHRSSGNSQLFTQLLT